MEAVKRAIAAFFDFLQGIVVIAAILVMIYLFIMSPQEISGRSMEPSFYNGEYILTNKIEYKFKEPSRGDVVIFKSPKNKDIDYIKRIIALPGERVSLRSGVLYVNNHEVIEPYLESGVYTFGGSYLNEGATKTIPAGKYFVVGDNRPHSSDSRDFGPIAVEEFIGKALLRYYPFSEIGIIESQKYPQL